MWIVTQIKEFWILFFLPFKISIVLWYNTFGKPHIFGITLFLLFYFYLHMLFIWILPNSEMQISKIILKRWSNRMQFKLRISLIQSTAMLGHCQCSQQHLLRHTETIFPSRKRPASPTGFSLTGRSINSWTGTKAFDKLAGVLSTAQHEKIQVFWHKMTKSQ